MGVDTIPNKKGFKSAQWEILLYTKVYKTIPEFATDTKVATAKFPTNCRGMQMPTYIPTRTITVAKTRKRGTITTEDLRADYNYS